MTQEKTEFLNLPQNCVGTRSRKFVVFGKPTRFQELKWYTKSLRWKGQFGVFSLRQPLNPRKKNN